MSGSQAPATPRRHVRRQERDLRSGWIAVALIPVVAVVAIVAGDVLIGLLGHPDLEAELPPLSLALLVAVPLVTLAAAPAVAAVVYGRRVVRAGSNAGWGPLSSSPTGS
ncbi:MAG TPA: hypothetical protein VFR74_15775 [Jiangellales bacterium]|nr:hypothetical protein [Jiangellales bacterium]